MKKYLKFINESVSPYQDMVMDGILDLDSKDLTKLETLPEGITNLSCSYNQLNSLPELPNSLKYLSCYNNPLECLIPEKFWEQQDKDWFNEYLTKIKSFEFQEKIIKENKIDVLMDLYKNDLIHPEIKQKYPDKFDIIDWGLI